jgi:hypothetical protein
MTWQICTRQKAEKMRRQYAYRQRVTPTFTAGPVYARTRKRQLNAAGRIGDLAGYAL